MRGEHASVLQAASPRFPGIELHVVSAARKDPDGPWTHPENSQQKLTLNKARRSEVRACSRVCAAVGVYVIYRLFVQTAGSTEGRGSVGGKADSWSGCPRPAIAQFPLGWRGVFTLVTRHGLGAPDFVEVPRSASPGADANARNGSGASMASPRHTSTTFTPARPRAPSTAPGVCSSPTCPSPRAGRSRSNASSGPA